MLFCLLHPMDHNTGPLARKSSTLCALLLISIAAFLVLAVPGQAVEEVGVAKHTKDGNSVTLKGVTKQASKDLKYAEYKKLFPTVCNFLITDNGIKLLYEGEGCSVELITKKKMEMIKFTTGYVKDGCNLDKCDDREASFEDGFSNLLPFAYSRNNRDIKNFAESLFYDGTIKCADRKSCGGTCMKQTFLEISWSTCDDFIFAHTHLIGEVTQGQELELGTKTEFNLEIYSNSFKMMVDTRSKNSDNGSIQCAPRNEAIVKPTTWEIKNGVGDLKDKHLLVFHLLPQTATRLIKKGNNVGKPAIGKKPSCKLFINFDRPDYEFLQVNPPTPPTTTTSTTTTTTKPKPGIKQPPPSPPLPPGKTTPTPQKEPGTTTNVQGVQEVQGTEGGSSIVIWIAVISVVVIAVIGLGVVGVCCYRKHKKQQKEEKEEREEKNYWANLGNDTEIAEQNIKRSAAEKPSLETEFVGEIFDRMKKEDTDNALKSEKILYKLYLPALEERGFDAIGTFREWRKKSGMIPEKGETLEEFDGRVEKAIAKRAENEKISKKKGGKLKRK